MESTEQEHHHYWPGKGCIPVTPQASRYGYVFPVHVTHSVWSNCITWSPQKGKEEQNADRRIYDLLDSCYRGMGKALAADDDMVYFQFKHWFWDRLKPKAKKQTKAKYGARLLLDPETEEPWLLIFDPVSDGKEVLKHGEPREHREDVPDPGEVRLGDGPGVDQEYDGPGAYIGTTEGS